MADLHEFTQNSYDYVIAGGGTAGLVLAARLSEDPNVTVAVIEAGQSRLDDPNVDIPALCFQMLTNPAYDWTFSTVPQKGTGGKVHNVPRGKMLGGSSGNNYLVYVRGTTEEYNDWAALTGDEGWNAQSMLKYHRKSECFEAPEDANPEVARTMYGSGSHGTDGPIHTSFQDSYMSIEKDFLQAATQLTGIEQPGDAWGGNHTGFTNLLGFVARTGDERIKGKRSYAARGYYEPVKSRPNLSVLCDATAERVELDGANERAIGLTVSHDGKSSTVRANREVIICCGTIKSPQLLELSGIGDPAMLRNAGVDCKVPLSGVGQNFQDHLLSSTSYSLKPGVSTLDAMSAPEVLSAAQAQYAKTKDGPLTSIPATAGFYPASMYTTEGEFQQAIDAISATRHEPSSSAFYRKQLDLVQRYLQDPKGSASQVHFIGAAIDISAGVSDPKNIIIPQDPTGQHTMSIFQCLEHPASRGSIHITSSNPLDQPAIDPAFLTHPADAIILGAAMRMSGKLVSTSPLADKVDVQIVPDPKNVDLTDLEQAKEWVKQWCMTQYHPIGTCAMGEVVDSRLRVEGVKGLRVCDASVFPMHLSGNICASVYAVAERAADLIKEDWVL